MKHNNKRPIYLTTEHVSKKFKNQFELVNFAISMAQNMIKTGRDIQTYGDDENPALLVIEQLEDNN
jgi:hypothetical protein